MAENKTKGNEKVALALGKNIPISTKKAIEIAGFLRYRDLNQAKRLLENILLKKIAVPMRRFNKDTGHRAGIGPGRYPMKTAKEILALLKSAESNARFKGMDTNGLYVYRLIANKGSRNYKGGRQRRRLRKSTNLEITLKTKEKK